MQKPAGGTCQPLAHSMVAVELGRHLRRTLVGVVLQPAGAKCFHQNWFAVKELNLSYRNMDI